MLKTELEGILHEEVLALLPKGFQVIGDVAVLTLPSSLYEFRTTIARALVSRHRNIRTVLGRQTPVKGEFRVAEMEILAGDRTIANYCEFGYRYRLDVTRVFFSARMASERRRVWMQVEPGEQVLVPFSGIGPSVIPIADRGAFVVAVEKNPDACLWLIRNIRQNRVEGRVLLLEGDVENHLPRLGMKFDRAVIPAPYSLDASLFLVAPLIRPGGWIHLYTFKKKAQIPGLVSEYEGRGLRVERVRPCGNVAPGVNRWAFDMQKDEAFPTRG